MEKRFWLGLGAAILLLFATWYINNKLNGRVIWSKHFRHPVLDTAASTDKIFVLRSNNKSGNGNILECFGLNGRQLWRHNLVGVSTNGSAQFDRVLSANDLVYLAGRNALQLLALDDSGLVHSAKLPSGVWRLLKSGNEIYAVTSHRGKSGQFSGALVFDAQLQMQRQFPFDGQFLAMDVGEDGSLAYIELVLDVANDYEDNYEQLKYLNRDGKVIFAHRGNFNNFGSKVYVEKDYVAAIAFDGLHILDKKGKLIFKSNEPLDDISAGRTDSGVFVARHRSEVEKILAWDKHGNSLWSADCEYDYFSRMLDFGNYLLCVEVDIEGHTLKSWRALPENIRKADNRSKAGDKKEIKRHYNLVCRDDSGQIKWKSRMGNGSIAPGCNFAIGAGKVLVRQTSDTFGNDGTIRLIRLD